MATVPTYVPDGAGDQNPAGLRQAVSFEVESIFDLALPDDLRETYGIRLSDQGGGTLADDGLEVVVRKAQSGAIVVQLRQRDFTTDANTTLQTITLDPRAFENQIQLRLTHVAGATAVAASFDLMKDGVVTRSFAFDRTVEIFTGEDWTRAQIITYAPEVSDSYLVGTYGTLSVRTDGTWTYALNNHDPNTQALIDGETKQDTFTFQVKDTTGKTDTETVVITVGGTSDNPTGGQFDDTLRGDRANNVFNGGQGFDEAIYYTAPARKPASSSTYRARP